MLPLDKGAAAEKVVELARSQWRVTIIEYRTGVRSVYDRRETEKNAAMFAALAEFEDGHPGCADYGETHGIERCRPVHGETR